MAKAQPKVTIRVKSKAKPGSKLTFTILVASPAGPATGKVTVKIGKKKVKLSVVRGKAVGKFRVPLLAKLPITARYSGDANNVAAQARKKVIKVKLPKR